MSTLTYATRDRVAEADAKPARRPFWSRVLDAIVTAQQRRADREVARYLATRGHILTDETEREILRGLPRGSTWLR